MPALACTADLNVRPTTQILCSDASDCPPGTVCKANIGRCVSTANDDLTAPVVVEVTITPSAARRGIEGRVTLRVSEPLSKNPSVGFASGTPALLLDEDQSDISASEPMYAYRFSVGDDVAEGAAELSATLVDLVGNEASNVVIGSVTFDFTPPAIRDALAWVPADPLFVDTQPGATVTAQARVEIGARIESATLVGPTAGDADAAGSVALDANGAVVATIALPAVGAADGDLVTLVLDVADEAGNRADPVRTQTLPLVVDGTPPTNPVFDLVGAQTGSATVPATASATGGTYVRIEGDAVATGWIQIQTLSEVTLLGGDGTKTVTARFADLAANEVSQNDTIDLVIGAVASDPLLVLPDTQTALKNGDVVTVGGTGQPGATVTSARLVELDGAGLEVGEPMVLTAGTDVAIAVDGTLSGSFVTANLVDGTKVSLEVVLTLGADASVPQNSRTLPVDVDLVPPQSVTLAVLLGTVVADPAIIVTATAGGASEMMFSGDLVPGAGVDTFVPYLPAFALVLTDDGTMTPQAKVITLTVRDGAHNTVPAQVNVTLDLGLPSAQPTIVGQLTPDRVKTGDRITFSGTATPNTTVIRADLVDIAADGLSAVPGCLQDIQAFLNLTAGGAFSGQLLSFGPSCPGQALYVALEVVVENQAGTPGSLGRSNTIAVDDGAPNVVLVEHVPAGDELTGYTNGLAVTLQVHADDPEGTPVQVRVTGPASQVQDTGWLDVTGTAVAPTQVPVTLVAPEGQKNLSVRFWDVVHNEAVPEPLVLSYDTTPPPDAASSNLTLVENAASDGSTDGTTNTFTLSGSAGAVATARVEIFGGGLASPANLLGTFPVTATAFGPVAGLGWRPDHTFTVAPLDDAGNLGASPRVITAPYTINPVFSDPIPATGETIVFDVTFGGNPPAAPVVVAVSLGDGATIVRSLGDASLVATLPDGGRYSVPLIPQAGDPEGLSAPAVLETSMSTAGTAYQLVDGVDENPLLIDVTPPAFGAGTIAVTTADPGGADTISGVAASVVDLAGADDMLAAARLPRVLVTWSGTETPAAVAADGSWGPVGVGDNVDSDVAVVIEDAAGNRSAPQMFANDIAPPVVSLVDVSPPALRHNATATVTFTVTDASDLRSLPVVTMTGAGRQATHVSGPLTTSQGPVSFTYSFMADQAQDAETSHVGSIDPTDVAGNAGAGPSTVVIDFTAPATLVTFPNTGLWNGQNLSGSASDATSGVALVETSVQDVATGLWWDGAGFGGAAQTWLAATGTSSWVADPIAVAAASSYLIYARATDAAGNLEPQMPVPVVTGDTAPPETFVGTGPTGVVQQGNPSDFTFSCIDDSGACSFECSLNGAAFSPCTSPLSLNVAGPQQLVVRAVDAAGSHDPTPETWSWNVLRAFVQVAAGSYHACGIDVDGGLWCWGKGSYGQLGDGTDTSRTTPAQVSVGTTWSAVTAGELFTCGVQLDNSLWCWGDNRQGQLGDGTTARRNTPVPVSQGGTWSAVAAGWSHACGMRSDGSLWCWGNNTHGELGDGTATSSSTPVSVSAGTTWSAVDAGYSHTCGVQGNGSLWCWGDNSSRQLGDGGTAPSTTPVHVSAGTTWSTVAAGQYHTCGLQGDASLWCWGGNGSGQLGDGTIMPRSTPVPVAAGVTWSTVVAGDYHTCGMHADGSLWCWGYNWFGQLGDGTSTARSTPAQVSVGTTWSTVSGGSSFTCGIQLDGSLWCWGDNPNGVLGDGTSTARSTPAQVSVGTTWSAVAAGLSHTCGVQGDASLWCWGDNGEGRLGDGSTLQRTLPVQVSAGTTWGVVTAGYSHTCGVQLDGSLWCWGDNGNGRLGDGSVTPRTTPVQVSPGTTWSVVVAGHYHTCGVQSDGSLWCWGTNDYGELGDGSTLSHHTPVQVSAGTTWGVVAAGYSFTCGVQLDGTLWCWGYNWKGQLGDGTSTPSTTLLQVSPGTTWSAVAAGYTHTCGIQLDGSLWCWGDNQLTPLQVGVETTWSTVAAGSTHNCGLQGDASLWCWGVNGYGQLGDGSTWGRASPVQVSVGATWSTVTTGFFHTCGVQGDQTLWCWGRDNGGQLGIRWRGYAPGPVISFDLAMLPACHPGCPLRLYCGNAILNPDEECDDGNTTNGDGCSAVCGVE